MELRTTQRETSMNDVTIYLLHTLPSLLSRCSLTDFNFPLTNFDSMNSYDVIVDHAYYKSPYASYQHAAE